VRSVCEQWRGLFEVDRNSPKKYGAAAKWYSYGQVYSELWRVYKRVNTGKNKMDYETVRDWQTVKCTIFIKCVVQAINRHGICQIYAS
jgi:hypothetical protein